MARSCSLGGEQLDAVADQPVEQIDDVVVVDQRVRQSDERSDQLLFAAVPRLIHVRHPSTASWRSRVLADVQSPGDHVLGHVTQEPLLDEGLGAQAREGDRHADPELGHDMPVAW